jgi:hypothetical protein
MRAVFADSGSRPASENPQVKKKGWCAMSRTCIWTLVLIVVFSISGLPLLAKDGKDGKGGKDGEETQVVNGLEIPLKCPKVRKEYLESFQKNKNNAELLAEYSELIALYVERDAVQTANDPKEARRAEEKLKKINSKIDKGKRSLFRIAKKMRKPIDKDYEQIVKKFNDFEEKAKKAEERGQEKMVMKYSQEAAKISQSMISLKNAIDMINFHLFFDDYEAKPEAEAEGNKGGKKK